MVYNMMNRKLSGLTAACLVFFGPAASADPLGDAQESTEAALSRADDGTALCFPPVTGPAQAHVIDMHSGKELLDPAITIDAPTLVDVEVGRTKEPAILVLSGGRPILWRIRAEEGATIAGVHLTGDTEQFISGLDEGIPVGRSFRRMNSDEDPPRCRNWVEAAGPDPKRDELRVLETEMNGLLQSRFELEKYVQLAESRIRELVAIDADFERGRAPDSLRAPFIEMLETERAKLADLREQMKAVGVKASALSSRLRDLSRETIRLDKLKGRLDKGARLAVYEERLTQLGKFELASHQHFPAGTVDTVTLSSAETEAFVARKREGERILADEEMPVFVVLPDDAPMMAAPADKPGDDGLAYLVERGYLGSPTEAARYACDKQRALEMVEGVEPPKKCRSRSGDRAAYTVLGPITVPKDVCWIRYYVPPGVATPQGMECHSYSRYLACAGIRDMREQVDCGRRLHDAARQ